MVMATAVDVQASGDIAASNLQVFLDQLVGKCQYAASAAGSAEFKANQAQAKADMVEGTAVDASSLAYTLDYHVRQMAALVGYTGFPSAARMQSLLARAAADRAVAKADALAAAADAEV